MASNGVTKIYVRKASDPESRTLRVNPVAGIPATSWLQMGFAIDGPNARREVKLAELHDAEQQLVSALAEKELTVEFA